MKRLIWKELMEQRYVPVAYVALVSVVNLMWFVMGSWSAGHGGMVTDRMNADEALFIAAAAVTASGLMSGSSTISSEVGHGTAGFLATLPASRQRIWNAKLAGSLLIAACAVALVLAVSSVVVLFLFKTAPDFNELAKLVDTISPYGWSSASLLWDGIAANAILCFAVAMFFSAILDRPIAAAGAAFIATVAVLFGIYKSSSLVEPCSFTAPLFIYGVPLYSSLCFFLASAVAFRYAAPNISLRSTVAGSLTVFIGLAVGVGTIALTGYTENLALDSEPQPVEPGFYSMVYPPSNGLTHQNPYRLVSYFIPRVQIGATYEDIAIERSKRSPASIRYSSADISSKVFLLRNSDDGGRSDRLYLIHYFYTPRLPLGSDSQEINVLDSSGQPIERITISARKAPGLFPPIAWFEYGGLNDTPADVLRKEIPVDLPVRNAGLPGSMRQEQ